MSLVDDELQSRLATLQTRGRKGPDALLLARIQALATRAASLQGGLRQTLDARLARLAVECEATASASPCGATPVAAVGNASPRGARSALSQLLEHLAVQSPVHNGVRDFASRRATAPPTAALDEVRRGILRARTESQLRQALEPASENAGPLNSARLVHRALSLMQEASPAYLTTFLSYVDMLARLEAATGGVLHPATDTARSPGRAPVRKRTKRSPV